MSKETNQVLGHGDEADGIEEYDNPLPDWWIGLFIVTIIWGVMYGISFHFIEGDSQEKRYEEQLAVAELRWPTPDGPAAFETSPELIAEGQEVFATTCVACHGADLSGGIGANLVDAEWLHGGAPEEIMHTITEGVTAKGMPAWGQILGPHKVQAATAYIVSMQTLPLPPPRPPGAEPEPAPEPVVADAPVEEAAGDEGTAGDEAAVAAADEVAEEVTGDPMVEGAEIFAQNCVACHAADMTGGVGPSLVDAEWIHGGELAQIEHTITEGVPAKGMVAWGPILGPAKISLVAQYVHQKAAEANP